MGQSFQLIAPRAKLALPWRGRPGEMLFDGSASRELVYLLAVPIRPEMYPKVSFSASAQTRNDRLAVQRTAIDAGTDSRETTHTKRKANDEVLVDSPSCKRAKTEDDHGITALGIPITLSELPSELHWLIFAHIEDVVDAVSLGATNRYFWDFGREYIRRYAMSFFGRWAGKNIVCVGEFVEPDDYPPGLFSADEQEVLRQTKGPAGDLDDVWSVDYSSQPFTLHHFTHPSVSEMEEDVYLPSEFMRLMGSLCRRGIDAAYSTAMGIGSDLWVAGNESVYLPEDQQWILRNLTTRQFVRSEAIALKPEWVRGPFVRGVGFAEVVLSRICWSTSDSDGMVDTTQISRGVWAGHRFDITTRTRHEEETNSEGEGWDDVSDEVVKEIAGLWESKYGPNWREKVRPTRL